MHLTVTIQPGLSTTFQCHVPEMFGQFKTNPRIEVVLKETNFSLLFLSMEATYICGAHGYEELQFGNGSELIFEDTAGEFVITMEYIKANQSLQTTLRHCVIDLFYFIMRTQIFTSL